MSEIRLAGNVIPATSGTYNYGHLQFVYVNEGREDEIEVQPLVFPASFFGYWQCKDGTGTL